MHQQLHFFYKYFSPWSSVHHHYCLPFSHLFFTTSSVGCRLSTEFPWAPKYFVARGPTFLPICQVIKTLWILFFSCSALKKGKITRENSLVWDPPGHCLVGRLWISARAMIFMTQLRVWLYCRFMNINWGLTLLLPEMHAERWRRAQIIYTAVKT